MAAPFGVVLWRLTCVLLGGLFFMQFFSQFLFIYFFFSIFIFLQEPEVSIAGHCPLGGDLEGSIDEILILLRARDTLRVAENTVLWGMYLVLSLDILIYFTVISTKT